MADIEVTAQFKAPRARSVKIYRLASPRVSEKSLKSVAAHFGLDPASKRATTCSDRNKLVYSEGPLEVTMFRASGGVRFRHMARWQMDDGGPDFAISDEAGQKRAQEIVNRFKWDGGEQRFLKAARLRVGEANVDKKHVGDRTIDVAVAFQRLVDGLPVDGPGGKLIIYLDRHGEATAVERLWRELDRPSGEAHLLPPEAAIENLARHLKSKRGMIEVSEIRLGYFEYGWKDRQQVLQPAYVLIGHTGARDSRARRKIVHVAPAIDNPPVRLTPPLRRKAPQPKRNARNAA
ncbi:hypothetical protein GCM10022276_12370 [Sphingomonas limnosediminicola]|uniref:Uncharacterized protein n=1 Tax=Sphingomonas limnosediminicola TaxID=940133 RepID=A0ABP7L4E7_9SPHN